MEILLKRAVWRDYLALTKPRVVLLHLITAATAMVAAAGGLPVTRILVAVLVGGSLVAGAANALNCYYDRDIDKLMSRTRSRPLPSGRLSPSQTLIFSVILAFSGVFILDWYVGWVIALLAVGALAYYILIYTWWLKRQTFWSSIIGSGAGAFPPIIGWVAVTGHLEITPFLLSGIIIFWTPPHFWSLGVWRNQEYKSAGLEVIPARKASRWIAVFSFLLIILSWSVSLVYHTGMIYQGAAFVLGLGLANFAARLYLKENSQNARRLFLYSLFYLAALFGALMIDKL